MMTKNKNASLPIKCIHSVTFGNTTPQVCQSFFVKYLTIHKHTQTHTHTCAP